MSTSKRFSAAEIAAAKAAAAGEPAADAPKIDWSKGTVTSGTGISSTIATLRRTRGPNKRPAKEQVAIRLDPEVVGALRAMRAWVANPRQRCAQGVAGLAAGETQAKAAKCGLAGRSTGTPTAGHQARAAPWFIMHRAGLTPPHGHRQRAHPDRDQRRSGLQRQGRRPGRPTAARKLSRPERAGRGASPLPSRGHWSRHRPSWRGWSASRSDVSPRPRRRCSPAPPSGDFPTQFRWP